MKTVSSKNCELEIHHPNGKDYIFLKVFFNPIQIWVDFQGLPPAAFLCASHDCQPILTSLCGPDESPEKRFFVDIDWVINEWDGPEELIAAIKRKKEAILKKIPELEKKYV